MTEVTISARPNASIQRRRRGNWLAIISTIGTNSNCGSNWMGQAFFSLFQTRNFYFATLAGLVCFAFAALLASFSYRYVELPFLQLRRKYVAEDAATMGNALRSDPRLSTS